MRSTLKNTDTALAVMSTGAGKTVAFSHLCAEVYSDFRQLRVLFLVHRLALVSQIEETLKKFQLKCGVYCGSLERYELDKQFTVSTIQTMRRMQFARHYDLVVIDEAHRITDEFYTLFSKLRATHHNIKFLGVTATPFTAKGYIFGEKKFFRRICFERGLVELTAAGRLVKAKLNGPPLEAHVNPKGISLGTDGDYSISELEAILAIRSRIETQVDDALTRLRGRNKIVWACVSIKHARMLEEVLKERGENAVSIASDVSFNERSVDIDAFRLGDARHMAFVSIVAEGFDYPPIDAVVFLRCTKSPTLYVQIVGRGLRTSPGKTDCLVLDYCRVIETNGPLDRPHVKGAVKLKKSGLIRIEKEEQVLHCGNCGAFYFAEIGIYPKCPDCGQSQDLEKLARQVTKQSRRVKQKKNLYSSAAYEGVLWYKVTCSQLLRAVSADVIRLELVASAPIPHFDFILPTKYVGVPTLAAQRNIAQAKRMLVRFFGQDERDSLPKMIERIEAEGLIGPDLICLSKDTHQFMEFSFRPKEALPPSVVSPQESLL